MATQGKEINTLEIMRQKLTGMKSVLSQMEVGSEAFKTQEKAVNELNDELKELESSYGDNQRKVGTYENATKSLKSQLREQTEQFENQIKSGDVAHCRSNGILGRAIRIFTRSHVNHTAMFIEIWGKIFVIESQKNGTNLKPFQEWVKKIQLQI